MEESSKTLYLSPCSKTNSKWIQEDNLKLQEENTRKALQDIEMGRCQNSKAQKIKANIDKWDFIKLSLCTAKEANNRTEENIFKLKFDKELITQIYKEPKLLNSKQQ